MSYVLDGERGAITVTSAALAELVCRAAESEPGARVRRRRRQLEIERADGSVRVALGLTAPYGVVLPELARAVQRHVAEALRTMCELQVEAVDVSVEEVE